VGCALALLLNVVLSGCGMDPRCSVCIARVQVVTRWLFLSEIGMPLALPATGSRLGAPVELATNANQPQFCDPDQSSLFVQRVKLLNSLNSKKDPADKVHFLFDGLRCFPFHISDGLSGVLTWDRVGQSNFFTGLYQLPLNVIVLEVAPEMDAEEVARFLARIPLGDLTKATIRAPKSANLEIEKLFPKVINGYTSELSDGSIVYFWNETPFSKLSAAVVRADDHALKHVQDYLRELQIEHPGVQLVAITLSR
jgi:hypothetical protein